jgi:hypothetical protein
MLQVFPSGASHHVLRLPFNAPKLLGKHLHPLLDCLIHLFVLVVGFLLQVIIVAFSACESLQTGQ